MWRQVVAQSPGENAADSDVLRYDVGWKALNTMLKAGRSLSGNERNCAFLNTGGSRFADISQATGLDFDDDGRAVASVDWDQDGDLDFWISNRTAPQTRFLRNNTDQTNHFIQFRLQGTTCNRDAVGARIALRLKGDPSIRSRTVRSGEAYLSQHSKWLHFGLGSATPELESITVTWPGGTRESFPAPTADHRYLLVQGSGKIQLADLPKRDVQLTPSTITPPPISDSARIVLIQPLPIPSMKYRAADNSNQSVTSSDGKPRLVTLWSSTCPCCMGELAEWEEHYQTFVQADLDVIAINLEPEDLQENAHTVFTENKFPFSLGFGSKKIGAQFDVLQRTILSRQRPLPLPSSFLIDGKGQLCIIYKGPVSPAQVAADAKLIGAPLDRILAASSPFAGKWLGIPAGSSPNNLAVRFVEGGFSEEAKDYLQRLTSEGTDNPVFNAGNAFTLLGAILLDQKQLEEAATAFRNTLKIDPHHRQAAIELAGILMQLKRPKEAIPHYLKALERRKDDPELLFKLGMAHLQSGELAPGISRLGESLSLRPAPLTHYNLGNAFLASGKLPEAIAQFAAAVTLDPNFPPSANNLAWLLAAHPAPAERDPKHALKVVQNLVSLKGQRTASHLDTLSVAQAANGLFKEALVTAQEAIALATKNGDAATADAISTRIKLYQAGTPYHE